MSSRIKNEEICNLYKEKNRDEVTLKYFHVSWYSKENRKRREDSNGYLELYEDFKNYTEDLEKLEYCEHKDNVSLYRVLRAWKDLQVWERLSTWKESSVWKEATFPIVIYNKKYERIGKIENEAFVLEFEEPDLAARKIDLKFLEGMDIDILNPANNRGKKANQKWHLYVSVFAYSLVCQNQSFKWDNPFPLNYMCLVLRLWMIENAEGQEAVLEEIEEAVDQDEIKDVEKKINDAFNKILKG